MANKKNNRKANYQFGVRHQANNANTKHAKMLAAAEKFGCFNMKHFGDGYYFMEFEPGYGAICGTRKFDDKKNLHEQMEELNLACGKTMATMIIMEGEEKKDKARQLGNHFLVENMISYMIHHDSEDAIKEMASYIYFLIDSDAKNIKVLQDATTEVKDMLHNHTEVYKLQYDNVKEIFQATDLFELVLNRVVEMFDKKN